ncbi:CBS domain-containing protein [Parapedobacter sp. ISTM3]|uniref:CBS domain-containing protein n=1 Tax=Parapedobacter luteus TaxID=623280 RepID=A0A1T5BDT5_9SPHI|nr:MULTISPECIES: CBS domain-containing protein [Parapedobacter]MBK1439574.1 CBS domain-containing protein [Parapedobacter sp. ISTM3]SKB45315.1 CBS domain-containing protein [Parapedobacter luteus]
MKTVKHILNNKPAAVYSVSQDVSVLEALKIMMEKNISALLVIENGRLQGIFTERDYARKIILQGKSSKDTPIRDVMTREPHTITQHEAIERCMQLMTHNHYRHLPVVEDNMVIGMLSIGDLVKYIIEDQRQTINQLESYINS